MISGFVIPAFVSYLTPGAGECWNRRFRRRICDRDHSPANGAGP